MDVVSLAWILASVLLVAVFLQAWKMLRSFAKAFVAMLVIGKVVAAVFYLVGLDRPLFVVSFENGASFTVTAAEAVFLSFLLTLAGAVAVAFYGRLLPRELRRALTIEGEGGVERR